MLWYNIVEFLRHTDSTGFNQILYERYYEQNDILYIGTTVEEDKIFIAYLKRGLRNFCADYDFIDSEKWDHLFLTFIDRNTLFRFFHACSRRYDPEYNNRIVYIGSYDYKELTREELEKIKNSNEELLQIPSSLQENEKILMESIHQEELNEYTEAAKQC